MKNSVKKFFVLMGLFILAQSVFAAEVTKYVAVKNGALRQKESTSAKQVCKVDYAAPVIVISEKNGWSYVKAGSSEGWIPTSALSKKKILASKNVSANAKEIAQAGKGLDKSLEVSLASEYNYNYAAVDKVEAVKVTESEVAAFMKEGKLKTGE